MRKMKNLGMGLLTVFLLLGITGFGGHPDNIHDDELVLAIKARLKSDARIPADRIEVAVKGGNVTLSGELDSVLARDLAEGLVATTIVGVHSVLNDIQVRPVLIKDDRIKRAVVANLNSTEYIEQDRIKVHVMNGVVELTGEVKISRDRRDAERVTKLVKGVKGVANLLQVTELSRPDRNIEKNVALYLLWAPYVDINKVDSSVKKGVVTLKGTVDHMTTVITLIKDIEKIEGVVDVEVQGLTVKSSKQKAS